MKVREVVKMFQEMELRFLYKPDGKIVHRYKETPDSEFRYSTKLKSSYFTYHHFIRITEIESEGRGKVFREYKGGLESIPKPIQEKEAIGIIKFDITAHTNTRGNFREEKVILEIEI